MLTVNVASNVSNSKMLTVIVKSDAIKSLRQNYIAEVKSLVDLTC